MSDKHLEAAAIPAIDSFAMFASKMLGITHAEAMERPDIIEAGQIIANASIRAWAGDRELYDLRDAGVPGYSQTAREIAYLKGSGRLVRVSVKGKEGCGCEAEHLGPDGYGCKLNKTGVERNET